MKTLLQALNLFSYELKLNFNKSHLYHSFVGIGLSLMVYGLMIFLMYYFSLDFINRNNLKLNYKESELAEETEISITDFFQDIDLSNTLNTTTIDLEKYLAKKKDTERFDSTSYFYYK